MTQQHILITRPQVEAEKEAVEIEARGFLPLIVPMLEITPLKVSLPDLSSYQALAFTSANGVRAFADQSQERTIPVFTIGTTTADTARQAGFETVHEADGTAERLSALLETKDWLPETKILHLSGEDVARDLIVPSITVERLALYKAIQAQTVPADCLEALGQGSITAIMFYSPRTAETTISLLREYGRIGQVSSIKALCISDSVVKCLRDLPWQDVQVADKPDQAAMLQLVDNLAR